MNVSTTGSLTVVGLGIQMGGQLTQESRDAIEMADMVFYVGCDPLTAETLTEMNPKAQSLEDLYKVGQERRQTYEDMVHAVCQPVREDNHVCFAVYGHPGVFVTPTHEAIRRLRAEGYRARMLPGISAADCLYADLGFDPGDAGCQQYEATDFMTRQPRFDSGVALILWQIGTIGESGASVGIARAGLAALTAYLCESYPESHEITAYHASPFFGMKASISRFTLAELPDADFSPLATLFVPALA